MADLSRRSPRLHRVSVVTPVFQGERTLPTLAAEIAPLTQLRATADGHEWLVTEWLLVYDNGPDGSADVIAELAQTHSFAQPIWLSRNFGQHAATLAGMASTSGDWIVTLDEDGQHNPGEISQFLDVALRDGAQIVYADPTNPAPHGWFRNSLSHLAKWVFLSLTGAPRSSGTFQSYRLVLGETGRTVAAYAGSGVFLDVALGWIAGRISRAPVTLRREGDRRSGYSLRSLLSHFWRLVLSSGTRLLRLVAGLGLLLSVVGVGFAGYIVTAALTDNDLPPGWTTTLVVVLLASGAILLSLGVIAEYVGVAVTMALGRPTYLIVSDPADGPLGRRTPTNPTSRQAQ